MILMGSADVLAGRKTVGAVKGSILFAGHKPSKTFLRRYTGYVEQSGRPCHYCHTHTHTWCIICRNASCDRYHQTGSQCASVADTLLDNLTVQEMLMYTAEMKNPVNEPLASKAAKVQLVIEQLALGSCRGVLIGNTLRRGISGAAGALL
jgi:hypothetical protein